MDDRTFAHQTRKLVRELHTGSLATIDRETGSPFVSFVAYATAQDCTPILLLSDLALHTKNLKVDDRVSLLVAKQPKAGDPMTSSRVTLTGTIAVSEDDHHRKRFIARHPDASGYADFGDFAFYTIKPDVIHLVGGFGVIETRRASAFMVDQDLASQFTASASSAVEHMNDDHLDAILLYATVLGGRENGDWRALDIDADGFDLALEKERCRLAFDAPMESFSQLRVVFKDLAHKARQ
ncbi:MAG: DUF2470 domain-containing protein [Pseudomonadota bacterium]